jgi:hypothetical protein
MRGTALRRFLPDEKEHRREITPATVSPPAKL